MGWRELVITAKLTAPISAVAVRRERLEEQLAAGLQAGVVLVVAGGGFGKSTLVSQFVKERNVPHLWYQMDELDVSPRPFFAHLTAGLQGLCPGVPLRGPGALTDCSRWQDPGQLLATFIRDWERCGDYLGRPPVLVLDDIHHLSVEPALRQVVRRLIAYLPRDGAVMLLGRRDPGLGLARLEHLGRVVRVSGEDLLFTPAEVRQLLEALWAKPVPEAEAEKACSLVRGWVLGVLRLAARRPMSETEAKTPLHRYMAEEMLADESPAVQRLLLAGSLLRAISPRSLTAVADAIFGLDSAVPLERRVERNASQLRGLAGRQWYLSRLPGGESYRLHDLMAEFLRAHLTRQEDEEALARGHAAAARHALGTGRVEEALAQALAGRNAELGIECLRQTGPTGWEAVDPERWLLLMDRLRQLGGDSPWVDFAEAQAHWQAGDVAMALQAYGSAARGFEALGDLEGRGAVTVEQARAFAYRGEWNRTEELAAEALRLLPPGALRERARVSDSRALAAYLTGKARVARELLQESLGLYRQAGDRYGESSALNNLVAVYYLPRGDLFRSLQHFERAHYLMQVPGRRMHWDPQGQLIILANVGLMRTLLGQHAEAEATLHRVVREAQEHGFCRAEALGTTFLGQLLTYMHRFEAARAALDRALQIQDEIREPLRTAAIYYQLGELALESGDPETAAAYARQDLERVLPMGSPLSEAESRLFLARTLVSAGCSGEALHELERAQALEEQLRAMELGSPMRQVYLALVRAQALGCGPDQPLSPESRTFLARGLQQARLHGYEAALYNSRASLSGLLAAALRHGVEREVTGALLVEWRQWDSESVAAIESRAAVEAGAGLEAAVAATAGAAGAAGGTPGAGPRLRVNLLGDFALEVDGQAVPSALWPRKRVRQLFQYLAVHHGRWVPVGDLIETLWPELEDRSRTGSFHVALHALRRVLEPALGRGRQSRFVETGRGLCRIAPNVSVVLDVDQFETACRAAEAAWEAGESAVALRAWEVAVALYRGPYLADDPQGEWPAPRRESLGQQYVRALLGLAQITAAHGQVAKALATCEQAMEADPYHEEACALAMSLLADSGRSAEALRLYRQFRDRLLTDLDTPPAPNLVALAARLSAASPGKSDDGPAVVGSIHDGPSRGTLRSPGRDRLS